MAKYVTEDTNVILTQIYTNNPLLHALVYKFCIMHCNQESNMTVDLSITSIADQSYRVHYTIEQAAFSDKGE